MAAGGGATLLFLPPSLRSGGKMYKSIKMAMSIAIVLLISGCIVMVSDSSFAVDESPDTETLEPVALTMDYLEDKVKTDRYSIEPGNYYLTEDLSLDSLYLYINSKINDVRTPTTIDLRNFTISSSATNTIIALGELTINSGSEGRVVNTGTGSNSGALFCSSTTIINGGTFNGTNAVVNNQFFASNGTITINDGIFSGDNALKIANGNVTIKDGTFEGDSFGIYCYSTSDSTPSVTVENGSFTGTNSAATVECSWPTPAKLTINGGTFTGNNGIVVLGHNDDRGIASLTVNGGIITGTDGFGISGNGTCDGTSITITNGTISSENAAGIYHSQNGNLTISGGNIYGLTGIQFCGAGNITITNGNIVGTGNVSEPTWDDPSQSSGYIEDGYAVSIVSRDGYHDEGDTIIAEISGGNFTSQHSSAISSYRFQITNGEVKVNETTSIESIVKTIEISNGIFQSASETSIKADPADIIPESNKYSISGGNYDKPVDNSLISENTVLVQNNDGTFGVADISEADITSSGTISEPFQSNQSTFVISSNGTHENVTFDVIFPDGTITVNGDLDKGSYFISFEKILNPPDGYYNGFRIDTGDINIRSITITVNLTVPDGHYLASAMIYHQEDGADIDPVGIQPSNLSENGTVTFTTNTNSYYWIVATFEESDSSIDVPSYPWFDDDDEYVPPIYVPEQTSEKDDTVKIVACAAAAVVAAIMAAFLVLGNKKD